MAEKTDLSTEEGVDQMKFGKLARLLQELGMTEEETDDMNVKDARAELKKRIRDIEATAATRRRPGQAAENLREILGLHNSKRERLAGLCNNIAAYLPKLDQNIKDNLKIELDHAAEDISQDVQEQLGKEECRILVAGETSSGKSTFLNLLLGGEILPVAHMSSTSTICELKYGETRRAVVHLHKSVIDRFFGQKTVTIPLDGTEECQEELKRFIHLEGDSRDSLPPAERVEVFWDLPLLKGGIVIVDSPGVGESKTMDKVVADYIPKVFAFLYIIDSSRAGGVQQDRLGQLLKLYAEKEDAEDFDPESAMFICNKWDTVPPKEQDKLKSDTFRKLSEMWPGLKESQLFFVSTEKAVGPGRILSEDFTKVLDGLDLLLPKSLDIKLETQYRLLTRLSSAALTHIDVRLNVARQNLDKEGKVKKYQEAKEHLRSFEEKAKRDMEELESIVRDNIKTIKHFLSNCAETDNWKEFYEPSYLYLGIFPASPSTWHKLKNEKKHSDGDDFSTFNALYKNLADNPVRCPWFVGHIKPMEQSVEQKTTEVIRSLENAYQQTMCVCSNNPNFSGGPIQQELKVHDVLSNRPWFWLLIFRFRSLGGRLARWRKSIAKAVLGSQSKTESVLRSCWKRAPADTPLVDILMQALKSEELLTELAERQTQPQRDLMAVLEADITKMKTVMEQTIDHTFKDTRSNDEILQTYEPQSRDINSFLGQLAMFHLTSTRRYEYDLDSLTGWTDTRNRLGGGSFGEVFRVQVPQKGAETPAALKLGVMPYDIVTTETACDFLKEEDNMRKLKGDHIVEYYGTACKKEEDGLRLGLVMELCEGTLEDRIVGNRDHNPAWWGDAPEKQAAAFSYTQNLAIQLCEGLRTIHDAGYIHRDLKLINILVTRDNAVKLADVGLTKREEKITGSIAGTALYAAPEVKERKVYGKSADIYSLGLILLEMWYGRTLYGLEDDMYSKRLEADLKMGWNIRMPRWEGTVPPIPEWTSLIHACLKKNPKRRPEIQECLDRISAMKVE